MITTSARRIAAVLAACLLAVLPAAMGAAPAVASVPDTAPSAGGAGRTTFGVQPSAAKKPDARPNFSYGATPGAAVKDHIAVFNYGTRPLTLRVYAGDAFTTADGGFDLYPAKHKSTDVGSWVKLGKHVVKVPARSHVIVPFTLAIPAKATPGDHTGGIVASLAAVRTDAKGDKVAVDQRVGARLYLRVTGELTTRLAVEDLHTAYHGTANPFGSGSATVTYTVRNTGNVRLAAHQAVHIRDLFGGEAKLAAPRDIRELLPGDTVKITASATGVVPAFRDTTTVTVDPQPVRGDIKHRVLPRVTRTEAFSAVPWAFLVVLLAVAAVVALVLVRRRRRRRPRPTAGQQGPRTKAGAKQTAGLAAALLLAAGAAVAGSPAEARAAEAGVGGLAVTPGKGSDTQPITLTAAGPCPAKSSNVIARVTGAGFPRGGQIVVGNAPLKTYPRTPGGGLAIPLIYTMRDYATTAGFTTLSGTYTFTVSCLKGPFDLTSLKDFTGSLRFTTRSAYRDGTRVAAATAPAQTPGAQSPGASGQPVPPTAEGVGSGGTGPGTGSTAPGAAPSAGASAGGAGTPVAAGDYTTQGSRTTYLAWSVGGFAVCLLALLTGLAHWTRGRRARAATEPGPEPGD